MPQLELLDLQPFSQYLLLEQDPFFLRWTTIRPAELVIPFSPLISHFHISQLTITAHQNFPSPGLQLRMLEKRTQSESERLYTSSSLNQS